MIEKRLLMVVLAVVLDALFGDPPFIYHPVMFIGALIKKMSDGILKWAKKSAFKERLGGFLLLLGVSAVSLGLVFVVLYLIESLHPPLGFVLETLLCWQLLAGKSLAKAAFAVEEPLSRGDVVEARNQVSMIVGRDTDNLNEEGIIKATVETVSENTNDGIIAPLLYMSVGGVLLMYFYKVVNTLDSMVGYTDPPYTHLGYYSAKLDDLLNFLPARLSAIWMILAGGVLGFKMKEGLRIFKRDRYKHKSPNSAQTESVCAGLLGINLGGSASYRGYFHEKPSIGDALRQPQRQDINHSVKLMAWTELIALVCILGAGMILRGVHGL